VPGYWDYPMMSDRPTLPSNDLLNPDPGNNANFYQDGYTLGAPYCTTVAGDFENSASACGTFDQGGNLWERNETATITTRCVHGGTWGHDSNYLLGWTRNGVDPTGETSYVGFRAASVVPESGSLALLLAGAVSLLAYAWRRRG
jgi:hypothetical protein